MSSELLEDCLIGILRLTEGEHPVQVSKLSEFLGMPEERVNGVLKVLSSDGSVSINGDEVGLLPQGLIAAREVRKKHHVMESFLVNVLGMDHRAAHDEAHRIEHTMSQESMQKLCHVTGNHIDNDCSACNNPCNTAITIGETYTLTELPLRRKGKIAFLRGNGQDDVKKLISMGFVPGREVFIDSKISENGPRVVVLGDSTVALDARLAKAIYVSVGA